MTTSGFAQVPSKNSLLGTLECYPQTGSNVSDSHNMDLSLQVVSTFVAQHYWLLASLVFLTLVVWYGTAPFSTFKKLGVPGPTPWPFVGNLPDFIKIGGATQPFHVQFELIKRYGRVCGVYFGRFPSYLISDVDLIKQVFIKEFDKFYNRPASVQDSVPSPLDKGLVTASGDTWKRIRSTISPTFSASKLKQVVPLMHESCKTLLQNIKEIADSGSSGNMYRIYARYTVEAILSSAFGVQVNSQADPDSKFTESAECITKMRRLPPLTVIFPFLIPVITWFRFTGNTVLGRAVAFLYNAAHQVLELRRKSGSSPRKDLLELMLQAELVSADGKKVSRLTDEELIAQSMTFMFAGTETTANTLAFVTYCLALNPDKQEKLLEEIDLAIADEEMPDYDTVQNLEYLDMVISESMRIYPPVFSVIRECNEACTINGIHFPKDVSVVASVFAMHRDPEYWPDPENFEPERFSPEQKQQRNPYSYMPFGVGPRNCIGLRFALLEAKMALACILKKFKFERAPDTQIPLQLRGRATMGPMDGVRVKIVRRK